MGGRSSGGCVSGGIGSGTCDGNGGRQWRLPRCVGEGGDRGAGGSGASKDVARGTAAARDGVFLAPLVDWTTMRHDQPPETVTTVTAAVPGDTDGNEVGVAAYRYVGGVCTAESRRKNGTLSCHWTGGGR